jgi:predicted DNA-binding transcriptional regulator AlpA
MHRTNLYLTDEQERALDARAQAAGISRSALVRSIIDRELSKPVPLGGDVEASLRMVADEYHQLIDGLFDDDPDLRIDR